MKKLTDCKAIISFLLLFFLQSLYCTGQEAFDKIFRISKNKISELVNYDYQIIHLEVDRLNVDETKEARIPLFAGYRYMFAASGDQDRIETIQIDLFEETGSKINLVQRGRDGIYPAGSSVINFVPDEDKTYLITVTPVKFASDNITTGRYYFIGASRPYLLEYNIVKKEDIRYNSLTKKYTFKRGIENKSSFTFSTDGTTIRHVIDNSAVIEYKIEMTYSDESNRNTTNYSVKGPDDKGYILIFNPIDKTVIILDQISKNNIFSGYRYHFQ